MRFARRGRADVRDGAVAPRVAPRRASATALSSPQSAEGPAPPPSLLKLPVIRRVLVWWTAFYGVASWLFDYAFSRLDAASAMPSFWFGLNRVVYAFMCAWALIIAIISTERFPVTSSRQGGRILLHVALSFLVSIVWGIAVYYLCVLIVPGWVPMGVPRMLASTTKAILFGYALAVVLIHIILRVRVQQHHEVELLRQAHLATQAQLQVLKLEMQPHFLFNALHAVSAQIHSDPNAANDTLVLVSDMLRHAVETVRVQEVELREELATLRLYTQIQQVRFGDRLRLTWDIDEEAIDAAVPHLLLQPLVENAIKYGLETHSKAGRIAVSARREGNRLCLRVWNDGPSHHEKSPRRGAGIGLANVRTRLAQLYGERQSFEFSPAPGGGTTVTIRLPFAGVPHRDEKADAIRDIGSTGGERVVARAVAIEGSTERRIDTMPGG